MKALGLVYKIMLWSILTCCSVLHAADPAQYGTPFSGVPDPRDAVIYQVNMRSFSSTRNFQGVIDRLQNIKALGVNVVYLMPIYPVGTLNAFNSPYCIKDYNSVGAEFGTLTDLRRLVDSAHTLGMSVILDWVVNHTSWDHPWIHAHKSWYQQDVNGNIVSPPGTTWTDVAQLNYSNDTMCSTMIDAMRFWVFTANIDGFRCDYANKPPVAFWQNAISSLRSISTHKLLLLAEGDHTSNYTAGFDYIFGDHFYYNSIKPIITSGSSATLIDNSNSVEYVAANSDQRVARYLSNHDIYGGNGSPFTIFGGKEATMAAFVVSAYMKSVPFIYNGMESGNTVAMPFPFTSTVIDWNEDPTVTTEMTKIISFYNTSNAIRRGTLKSYDNADVCAFKKISGMETVFVAVNLKNASKTFTLPDGIANTVMHDAFTNEEDSLKTSISLAAYEYKVFAGVTDTNFTGIKKNNFNPAFSVFPNPATNGFISVRVDAEFKNASFMIYDLHGREVYQGILVSEENLLDISTLKKGFYFVKIITPDIMITQKLIVK